MNNGYGILTGVVAGIVAALVQLLISWLEHRFIRRNREEDRKRNQLEWRRDEIYKMLKEVNEIIVPAKTITDDDIIANAYHLIIADYERSKVLLYNIQEPVSIKKYFDELRIQYNQLQNVRLGLEDKITVQESRIALIEKMEECKEQLDQSLRYKEKEVLSKL